MITMLSNMFSLFLMKAAGLTDRTETRQVAVVQDSKINILEPQPKGLLFGTKK